MKKLLFIFIALIGMVCVPAMALACTSNQIDVAGDGSNCVDSKFEVTTTSLSAGDVFTFFLSPKGTFYIDCGDDGVLSEESPRASEPQTTITGPKTVVRTSADTDKPTYYTCTYSTGGVKHIRLAGRATRYTSGYALMSTIRFVTTDYDGITPPTHTPTGNLVASISGSLGQLFPTLNSGDPVASLQPRFYQTFANVNITSIPENLFDGIFGCGGYMFYATFAGTAITSIPAHLFDAITCPTGQLFRSTFTRTQITSIPEGLYKNIAYSADTSTTLIKNMFFHGFNDNQSLTGYIPPSLFGDLNNSGLNNETMTGVFASCPNLATECPAGTEQYITGYEQYFSTHVACKKTGLITCAPGEYLPKRYNNCIACDSDHTCSGGNFTFSATTDQGALYDIVTCESGYFLPADSRQCAACPSGATCAGGTYRFNATHSSGLVYPNPITNDQTNTCSADYDYMVAQFTPIQYTCNSGEYLPADTLGCQSCPTNYTCEGGTYTYNATRDQGAIQTTFQCSSGYFLPADTHQCVACPTGATCAGGTYTYNATDVQGVEYAPPITTNQSNSCSTMYDYMVAQFTPNQYNCSAGEYLPANAVACEQCSSDYDCAGGTFTFNENDDQGLPTCPHNQFDADGTCVDTKFSVTTTNLSANDEFKFTISAKGTFYVDCGDGGTLSSNATTPDVSGKTITRSDRNEVLYTCTYSSGGVKTIKFSGTATQYNTNQSSSSGVAAIRFGHVVTPYETKTDTTPALIASVDGSLGSIFPGAPFFYYTFAYATNLASIPGTLFSGVTTAHYGQFRNTFDHCTSLASIPSNLFADLQNVTSGYYLFSETFANCTSLTTVPDHLLDGIITKLGGGLEFPGMFMSSGLTSLPPYLFSKYKASAISGQFLNTFNNCTHLSGYIPPSLFAGLIESGSPYGTNLMNGTFYNTGLDTACPSGTTQYTTGYESYWSNKVACVDSYINCNPGEYLIAHQYTCSVCPVNNYCTGGSCQYNESSNTCITPCANGLFAPAGMWESAQCGRIFHVGDLYVYLRSTKKTVPALHLDIDKDGTADFFGNMTRTPVPMNKDFENMQSLNKLVIYIKEPFTDSDGYLIPAGEYYVYDDTVTVPQE